MFSLVWFGFWFGRFLNPWSWMLDFRRCSEWLPHTQQWLVWRVHHRFGPQSKISVLRRDWFDSKRRALDFGVFEVTWSDLFLWSLQVYLLQEESKRSFFRSDGAPLFWEILRWRRKTMLMWTLRRWSNLRVIWVTEHSRTLPVKAWWGEVDFMIFYVPFKTKTSPKTKF